MQVTVREAAKDEHENQSENSNNKSSLFFAGVYLVGSEFEGSNEFKVSPFLVRFGAALEGKDNFDRPLATAKNQIRNIKKLKN